MFAQVDIYNNPSYQLNSNVYYQDISNFQNQFEGTWLFQQGLFKLEVKFRKKEMMTMRPGPNAYFADVLVGEYKYIDASGIERVNSLNNLNIEHSSMFQYSLFSRGRINNNAYPLCTNCPVDAKRLIMRFDEMANDDFGLRAEFIMRRVVENGVEKIIVNFINIDLAVGFKKTNIELPSTFTDFSLPYGIYTLIKQP